MIGDKIIILDIHKKKASIIFKEVVKKFKRGSKFIVAIAGISGTGKCLGKGTHILMFDGTIKKVENIQKGDLLMGPDSKPRTVLSTCRGKEELFKIKQTKGDDYVVNKSHILSLKKIQRKYVKQKNYKRVFKSLGYKTVNLPLTEFLKKKKSWNSSYKGYKTAINFQDKQVPIDPYFIGLWLGDGNSRDVDIATQDFEIIEYLKKQAKKYNLKVSRYLYPPTTCPSYALRSKGDKNNIFLRTLQELNLIQYKHIPAIYKINSRKKRLKLLAGLLDSDGWLDKKAKGFVFYNSNKKLAKDVEFLARSLGFGVSFKERIRSCKKVKCRCYDVSIWGKCHLIPTKIKRKQAKKRLKNKNPLHCGIKEIKSLGVGEYYGFTIDKDHLFVLGDFTVTHNTEVGNVLQELLWKQKKIKSKCVHIDDYYKTTWKERNKIRKQTNIIGKDEINWKILNKVLNDFNKKEKFLHIQRIHKYLDDIEYTISPNESIDVLILEGLYALYATHFDLGVYLEGNYDQTYGFRKMRNKENPDNKFRVKVVQIESRSVWNSKQKANKIIKWRVR
jgi:replicative DNA helicase